MDSKEIQASRDLSTALTFAIIFLAFVVANAWVLQMSTSGDLGAAHQTALTVFIVGINLLVLLGFDNSVQQWKVISQDFGTDDSKWVEYQQKAPFGLFRVVVALVPLLIAITQVTAIFA